MASCQESNHRFRAGSAQEVGDGMNHSLLFVFPQLGKDGQSENFACRALSLREIAFAIAERLESLLKMQRNRIEDLAPDLTSGQKFTELVAAGATNHILVPGVPAAGNFAGKNDAVSRHRTGFSKPCGAEERVVPVGQLMALLVPSVHVLELYFEDRGLETVEPRVPAEFVMVIAAAHAVLAQHPRPFGQRI